MTNTYAFEGDLLRLPNGDSLVRRSHVYINEGTYRYILRGPKNGIRHAAVELWVHGGRARDEAQFLSYLNGDAHDQSKCQVYGLGVKFWDVA